MLNTDFVERVKELVGTPYAFCDCKDVIAKSLGIRFAGTNWLWRSIKNSNKYRYLIERVQSPPIYGDMSPGDILFKIREGVPNGYDDQPDAYHVGVYIGEGKVIHSSPKTGVRADEYIQGAWQGWGRMKQVEYETAPPIIAPDEGLTLHEMISAIYQKLCAETIIIHNNNEGND